MAAATKWKLYEHAKLNLMNGLIHLTTDSFYIGLFLSAGNAGSLDVGTGLLADLTQQVATNFGYTQATGGGTGKAVTLGTTEAAGVVTVDESTNPVWTAAGGSITARFAVIFDDTAAGDPLLCMCILDSTPADVTATTGNTLTITVNVAGLFTLSGATAD
jgi:hypothetical protein